MVATSFQPTLAAVVTIDQLANLDFPVLGFYKYDGIRSMGLTIGLVSRKLKKIPNAEVRKKFAACAGFDGELISGQPNAEDVFNRTSSQVMTKDMDAVGVTFYVFDYFGKGMEKQPYEKRRKEMELRALFLKIKDIIYAPMKKLNSVKEVLEFEAQAIRLKYEGIILRSPDGIYKRGRSTLSEQILLKLKRFEDSEAEVLKVLPRMKNNNKKERDERGYAKRSSHKAGKKATPRVGKYLVRDLKTKKIFKCGTGKFSLKDLEEQWRICHRLPKKILKYRFQPAGVKELPRFPRALGWRSQIDF